MKNRVRKGAATGLRVNKKSAPDTYDFNIMTNHESRMIHGAWMDNGLFPMSFPRPCEPRV